MDVEDKNRGEILFRMAADLFAKSKGGEEQSAKINRLRGEIKKAIESENTIFGKFRQLMASFEEIIPEEKQRYNAAIKALSTTSKLSRQELVKAIDDQLEELKILEKSLMPADWRAELKAMEAKAREMKDEISKLREKIGQLESEEKGILSGMAAREKEMQLVEKAMGELFKDIGAEVTSIKKRIEEFTAESAAAQPVPPADNSKSDIPGEKKEDIGQKSETGGSSAPQDTELQKKCPMCGGKMNFHSGENKWVCYSCAYEELKEKNEGGGQKSEIPGSSAPHDEEFQKKCPMCGGHMDFNLNEEMWQCYSCAYEELKKDEVTGKSEGKSEQAKAPESLFPDVFPKAKKDSSSSNSQPSGKKKNCPVCHKKMDWFQMEKTWRCPFCDYQRSI